MKKQSPSSPKKAGEQVSPAASAETEISEVPQTEATSEVPAEESQPSTTKVKTTASKKASASKKKQAAKPERPKPATVRSKKTAVAAKKKGKVEETLPKVPTSKAVESKSGAQLATSTESAPVTEKAGVTPSSAPEKAVSKPSKPKVPPKPKAITSREVVMWHNLQFTFLAKYSDSGRLGTIDLEIRPKKKKLLDAFALEDNQFQVELAWGESTLQTLNGELLAKAMGGGRVGIFGTIRWTKTGQPNRRKMGFWTNFPFQMPLPEEGK